MDTSGRVYHRSNTTEVCMVTCDWVHFNQSLQSDHKMQQQEMIDMPKIMCITVTKVNQSSMGISIGGGKVTGVHYLE